jgi:signal transduction histidine kinase
MNVGIKFRLGALGSAVVLMGALIAVVVLELQRLAVEGEARLSEADSESFQIAEHFKDRLREVNDKLRHYGMAEQPAAWEDYSKSSEELKKWIGAQAHLLRTTREAELLKEMDSAYEVYLQSAQRLHESMKTDNRTGVTLADYNGIWERSRRVFDLSQELARAHLQYRTQLLENANHVLKWLHMAVLVLLGCLFLFGVGLAASVYRNLISPLRVQLVESQTLVERQEKLASLGMLAAGVAHEVRNPLTAIKTAIFTQQRKLAAGSPAHRDAELIEQEISRLEHIVNDFLLFARPAPPASSEVSADAPLKEVQALLSPELAKDSIRLVREECEPWRVRADSSQIKQVLINLIRNAAESIGESGTITLRARLAKKRLRNGETDGVVLEVADTGKGIPPEVQKRLCDPFFTTKDTGTGLGLAIAARLVEMNGGALQYQTQLNRGSTFGIVLPVIA